MRNFKVVYGFLDKVFYESLKTEVVELFNKENKTVNMRSHFDITESEMITPNLLKFIKNYVNNPEFWLNLSKDLHIDLGKNFTKEFKEFIEPNKGLNEFDRLNPFFFSRVDVGYGMEGYGVINGGKGLHIDNTNRVISCLLYFNSQSDFEGGEFEICDKDGSTIQRISLQENLLISSSQNKDGWHRVNPLTKLKGDKPRIGIYFALSTNYEYWER
jgi:plasmid maintenance system antidote protein VapI